MAIDLNRFIATFFDEAQEHLESIEENAMALGRDGDNVETLNAIFRAAHSIKGGSGTFGFTQLTDATHEMETLFDGLRKGKGKADETTVRVLLDACDVFKAHLARLKAGDKGNDPAMDGVRAQLIGYRASAAPGRSGPGPGAARGRRQAHRGILLRSHAHGNSRSRRGGPEPGDRVRALRGQARARCARRGSSASSNLSPSTRTPSPCAARAIRRRSACSVEKIDRIVNLVGELVIAQAMMQQAPPTPPAPTTSASRTAWPRSTATRATCSRR